MDTVPILLAAALLTLRHCNPLIDGSNVQDLAGKSLEKVRIYNVYRKLFSLLIKKAGNNFRDRVKKRKIKR
jgi:hypothetical protein